MTKSGRERQFCFIPPQWDRSSFLSHFSFTFHKCSTQSCKGSFRMFGRRKRQICTLSLGLSHATKQCVVLFCSHTEILNMNPIRISHSDIGGILFGLSSKPIFTYLCRLGTCPHTEKLIAIIASECVTRTKNCVHFLVIHPQQSPTLSGVLFELSTKHILTYGFAALVRVPKQRKIDRNHFQFSLVCKK
jgi:hypothetical protein